MSSRVESPRRAHGVSMPSFFFKKKHLDDDTPGLFIPDMRKEEIRTHPAVKTAVVVPVARVIEELDFGDLYINGVLISNAAADVSNNPDAVAVSWTSLAAKRVRYV